MKISRKGYYSITDIQYELIHQHKHRETFFLPYNEQMESTPPIRWLNASAIKFMQMHWNRYLFLDKKMNLYHSLATYKDFPTFSYNWRTKSQQQQIWLKEFASRVIAYDLFIETDSPDLKLAHDESIEIKQFLDKYKVKYYVKFSGSKGFHFVTPFDEFSFLKLPIYDGEREKKIKNFKEFLKEFPVATNSKKLDIVLLFKVIAHRIKMLLALETVDTSVQDVKRVMKSAYSWDVKSNLIAYPLDDSQFLEFSKSLVKPEKVIGYDNHRRRLIWRHDTLPKDIRERGMEQMLKDLGVFS